MKNFQKSVDIVATPWYNSVTNRNTKGEKMSSKVKVHISLNEQIYLIAKAKAEEMGIPFSTYLSILISNDNKKKEKK